MPYRHLVRSLAAVAMLHGLASLAEPPTAPSTRARMNELRELLGLALQREDIEVAAATMESLLACEVEPTSVALAARAHLSHRAYQALIATLAPSRAPGMEEVILLLAVGRSEWDAVDSLTRLPTHRAWTEAALQMVGAQAEEGGDARAAAWAYGQLRSRGREWAVHATLPYARALAQLGRPEEAAALLDSVAESSGSTRAGDCGRVLRARLYMQEGAYRDALRVLEPVGRSRPERTEADLLASLIRFAHDGTESSATAMEAAARARPDLPEASDAYALAQIARQLDDPRLRDGVMAAVRMELCGRFDAAARGYRAARAGLSPALGTRLGIREARCWERAGMAGYALKTWHELPEEGDDGPLVLVARGDCLLAAGLPDSARVCFMAVLERYPSSPHAGRARSRLLQ